MEKSETIRPQKKTPTERNSYDDHKSLIGDRKPFMKSDKDLISDLPDGILHNIIHRLEYGDQAAQTIAISRRWETLWRSYPFVEFDICKNLNCNRDFQKFAEATINRFTRDSLLRMEILKLSLMGVIDEDRFVLYSPLVEQLVDLASRRKAEKVSIFAIRCDTGYPNFCLPCRLLSDSAAKILELSGIELKRGNDPLPHSLKFLRSLYIDDVVLEDERILGSLIASSPELETMVLLGIPNLSKLQVSNVPKLRTLQIRCCEGFFTDRQIEEIEIAAPQLHTLYLWSEFRCKIELTAPQLHHVDISYEVAVAIAAVLSKLPLLKSLIISHSKYDQQDGTTLRLSVPKLEELTIINPYKLSNIHIDGGLDLTKFSLEYDESCPEELQKCEINNAGACRWELHIATEEITYYIDPQLWFPQFKNFMVRYPQFRTVYIENVDHDIIAFDQNEVDNSAIVIGKEPSENLVDQLCQLFYMVD
ncbi:F-box/FBD/LRR-repeat protein At3g52680 [Linum perenne]